MASNPLPPLPAIPERNRLSLDLSASVLSLLDHVSEITGVAKAQIVNGALLDALPALVERADKIKQRQGELSRAKK